MGGASETASQAPLAAAEAAKTEALSLIDLHLGHLQRRELVSSDEMSDLLLDLRMLLTYVPTEVAEPDPPTEAVAFALTGSVGESGLSAKARSPSLTLAAQALQLGVPGNWA